MLAFGTDAALRDRQKIRRLQAAERQKFALPIGRKTTAIMLPIPQAEWKFSSDVTVPSVSYGRTGDAFATQALDKVMIYAGAGTVVFWQFCDDYIELAKNSRIR